MAKTSLPVKPQAKSSGAKLLTKVKQTAAKKPAVAAKAAKQGKKK